MSARFTLDKRNAKLMGVCSGFARWAEVDVTMTRIAFVVLTLLGVGSTIIVYLLAGWIAPDA